MAYVDEEQYKTDKPGINPNADDTGQAQPPVTSSAPGSGPGATGKAGAPQATPAQPFQNLQAYLSANQPQVQAQADKLSTNLNNQYGQVTADIDAAKNQFNQQVAAGYQKPDVADAAANNPAQFSSDPNNVKAFQQLYAGSYFGPQDFESTGSYGDLSGRVNKASSNAELATTIPVLQGYFQTQSPTSTKGGNTLDSVLLQGSPDAFSKVSKAAGKFKDLPTYLGGAASEADMGIAGAKNEAKNIAGQTKQRFTGEGGVIPKFNESVQNNLNAAQAEARQRYEDVITQLSKRLENPNQYNTNEEVYAAAGISPQVAADLGLTPDQIAHLVSANSASGAYFKNGQAAPSYDLRNIIDFGDINSLTKGNVSTANDYANAKAFQELMNEQSVLNPSQANLAGTGNRDLVNLDYSKATDHLYDYLNNLGTQGYSFAPPAIELVPPQPSNPGANPSMPNIHQSDDFDNAFSAYKSANPGMDDLTLLNNFLQQWKNTPQPTDGKMPAPSAPAIKPPMRAF